MGKIMETQKTSYGREESCIMPECPYCPACEYGLIIYPEDTMPGEEEVSTEWRCLFEPER